MDRVTRRRQHDAAALSLIHLHTLFMLVPNFNSMVRIDKSLIEAVIGGGATEWRTIRQVTLPLVVIGTSPIALWWLQARQASKRMV